MVMIIDGKIVSKLASYQTAPNLPSYLDEFFEFKDPQLLPLYWEALVTNGLGYKKLGYHEDSEKGLTRHLGVMESAEEKNYSRIKDKMRFELGVALTYSERKHHLEGRMYEQGMEKIENAVDSLKKRIESQGREDREMISRIMSEMLFESKQAIKEHYSGSMQTNGDSTGSKPKKQSVFKQILSWIQ